MWGVMKKFNKKSLQKTKNGKKLSKKLKNKSDKEWSIIIKVIYVNTPAEYAW